MNTKGFTLIEVLIAFTILMTIITSVLPIATILSTEGTVLSDRRVISSRLHDELQLFLRGEGRTLPADYTLSDSVRTTRYSFFMEEGYIKGCVEWNNAKQQKELYCIYGIKEE
ncbi:type II secretion system protein [Virgibacillus sediminis]|uniref:Type II secretion system protein n=1 Tax=Virgibacillus sediminis TaxID=202260 RepID=A0ABV7A535_9BACI